MLFSLSLLSPRADKKRSVWHMSLKFILRSAAIDSARATLLHARARERVLYLIVLVKNSACI